MTFDEAGANFEDLPSVASSCAASQLQLVAAGCSWLQLVAAGCSMQAEALKLKQAESQGKGEDVRKVWRFAETQSELSTKTD